MSDAPSLIASSMTFWMNLTTGASSTSLAAASIAAFCASSSANSTERSSSISCLSELSARSRTRAEHRAQLVVLDHDRVDRHRGLELDLVEHLGVGRVRDRHREPVAALAQRQHAPLAHQLLVDEVERQRAGVERLEVEQRQAEGPGSELRDVERAHLAAGDELLDEARTVVAGLDGELLGDVLREAPVLDEGPREPAHRPAVAWVDRHPRRPLPWRLNARMMQRWAVRVKPKVSHLKP